jgi:hypothetical protein
MKFPNGLPWDRAKILNVGLSVADLRDAILAREFDVTSHAKAVGDNRCHYDDYKVHRHLDDTPKLEWPVPLEKMMEKCTYFFTFRRAAAKDAVPTESIYDVQKRWTFIQNADEDKLLHIFMYYQEAIFEHRSARPITIKDDRLLYARVIPGNIELDLRLPPREDFLGEAKAPCAGCPAFWRSHANCDARLCNPHQWGPCEELKN